MKKEEKEQEETLLKIMELKHNYKMEQLKYQRDTEKLKHQWELERMRIKTAEIKRNYERREYYQNKNNY